MACRARKKLRKGPQMSYFKSQQELEQVIGGFLRIFPKMEPLMREAIGHKKMALKLELSDPDLTAEIDFTRSPLEIRFKTKAEGAIALTTTADHFHRLLLGILPIGPGVNHKQILIRGSVANLMSGVALFYLAPTIYPFFLESIGRKDLILPGKRPPLHGEKILEDKMTKIVSPLAFLLGYALGLLKKHLAKNLDIVAALESMGKGLISATGQSLEESKS